MRKSESCGGALVRRGNVGGSMLEWYVGAAEVYDGAAERIDAVSKSAVERRRGA